jgi:hypothetical protein
MFSILILALMAIYFDIFLLQAPIFGILSIIAALVSFFWGLFFVKKYKLSIIFLCISIFSFGGGYINDYWIMHKIEEIGNTIFTEKYDEYGQAQKIYLLNQVVIYSNQSNNPLLIFRKFGYKRQVYLIKEKIFLPETDI